MQRRYQPNMFFGSLVAIGITAIATVGLKIQDAGTDMVQIHPRATRELIHKDDPLEGGSGGFVYIVGLNGGFIPNLRIIPDRPVVKKQSTPVNYTSSVDFTPEISDMNPGIGEGTGSGLGNGDVDFGLPEVPRGALASSPSVLTFPESQLKLKKSKSDRDAIIRFQYMPRQPEKARFTKGQATVRFTIDEGGNLRHMVVLNEQPEGLGFGQSLKDALYDAFVEYMIVNGQSVSTEVTFWCDFDIGSQKKPVAISAKNVSVILP